MQVIRQWSSVIDTVVILGLTVLVSGYMLLV